MSTFGIDVITDLHESLGQVVGVDFGIVGVSELGLDYVAVGEGSGFREDGEFLVEAVGKGGSVRIIFDVGRRKESGVSGSCWYGWVSFGFGWGVVDGGWCSRGRTSTVRNGREGVDRYRMC